MCVCVCLCVCVCVCVCLCVCQAWGGGYNEVVSHGVLQALCSAGLPLLLRYAVDDSSTAVISAALSALHSLLVPRWEEVC